MAGMKYTEFIDLFLFMGQSNMAGRGITSKQWPQEAPALTPGAGWEFRAISDPTKLYPIAEPFGVEENNPAGINDVFSSGVKAKTGSMVTAFANAHFEKTGVPIVAVSASKGGSRIAQWLPGAKDGFLQDALERYASAVRYLTTDIVEQNPMNPSEGIVSGLQNGPWKIRHRYMLWCQGESDGDKGTTAEEYKERFHILWQEMKNAGVEKCFLIQTGRKNVPGQEDDYEEIRRAQEELCVQEKLCARREFCTREELNGGEYDSSGAGDIIMASRCLGGMLARGLMKDAFHYYQQAYNECGAEAGSAVGDYVKMNTLNLATARCLIRKFTPGDANELYETLSDAEVMKYIEPPFDLEQTLKFIQEAGLCEPPLVHALVWKETGKVIGHVIFHQYEEDSCEIGWILNRGYWGKGIADEVTKALIEYAKGLEVNSCVIECDAEQAASKQIAVKNGFIYEGEADGCDVYRLVIKGQ